MANANDVWELSKENIQPLQSGRKQDVLKVALASDPGDIAHQQQVFEKELRTYTGDDPLSLWYKYVKWVEQNFPKGGRDGHLQKLIQQCLSVMKDKTQYYDDKRFIDLWLKFANMAKPIEAYNYMYSRKIGCQSASLFLAWAWELEQLGNIKKADQVLSEGIKRQAEPLQKLKDYYSQFEIRVASKVMSENNKETEEKERSAFSVLKPQKKKTAPVTRIGENIMEQKNNLMIGRQQPLPRSNVPSGKIPFRIHNSENVPSSLPVQSENSAACLLMTGMSKENEKKPSKWNKVKLKQQVKTVIRPGGGTELGFKLHCDEDPQPIVTPRTLPKVSNVLRVRHGTTSPVIALFEPPDPTKRPMYDKTKVYGGAEEFSLEEIRAAAWLRQKQEVEKERLLSEQAKMLCEREEQTTEEIRAAAWLRQKQEVEKERLLSEQAKMLCEQEEQIQTLKKELQMLKIGSQTTAVKQTDENIISIPSGKRALSYFQPISPPDESNNIQNPDLCQPSFSIPTTKFDGKNCQKELFPDQKFTKSYNEASSMVRDLYNGTLINACPEVSSTECSSIKSTTVDTINNSVTSAFSQVNFKPASEPKIPPKNTAVSATNLPFTLYSDPTESISVEKPYQVQKSSIENKNGQCFSPKQKNDFDEKHENIENEPPKDYIQESVKRQLSGILEPSLNVYYVPLDEQELEGSDDEENLYKENNNLPLPDETLVLPCNTQQFVSARFLSSTPRTQAKHRDSITLMKQNVKPMPATPDAIERVTLEDAPDEPIKPTLKEDLKILKDQSTTYPTLPAQLSVIMETSRECYKSSSSSGSSASITKLSQFSQCYSHEKSNIQRHLSRGEMFKEPRQVSKDSSNKLTERENSFPSFKQPKPVNVQVSSKDIDTYDIHVSDIDPFDEDLIAQKLLSLKLSQNRTNLLQISDKSIRSFRGSEQVKIRNESYSLERLVAEGAYGKVYEAEKECKGSFSKVAIKVGKNSNSWEYYICTTLEERLEAISCLPDVRLSVLKISSALQLIDGILLVSEFSSRGTLLNFVNNCKIENRAPAECVALYLTLEMLQIMSKVHDCRIIHADIKPDNILLRNDITNFDLLEALEQKRTQILRLIDFGRAIDLNTFQRGICFRTVLKEKCIEMRENKPWVFQLDWYGILNCIHVLLFSEYMKVKKNSSGKWEIEKKFKRYWNQSVWIPLFDELLNIPSCYQQPNIQTFIRLIENDLRKNVSTFNFYLRKFFD